MATTSTTSTQTPTATIRAPPDRDRQARGKDPYTLTGEGAFSDGGDYVWEHGKRVRKHHETFEQKERTSFATRVLANPDLLLWHAQAKGDSVTSQRLRFTAMLCGYDDYYELHPKGVVVLPRHEQQEQQQQQQQQPHQSGPSGSE